VAGSCVGIAGTDCGTATGHIGVSVVGTLSINELRAINFGNVAVSSSGAGDASVTLDQDGTIGAVSGANTDGLTLLSGADANGGVAPGEPGTVGNDGQHSGLYEIDGYNEGGQTRVYISFANTSNEPIECNSDGYYQGNSVPVIGPAADNLFNVTNFTFDEDGHDVYGHYIDTDGLTDPVDIEVGATLNTDATSVGGYPVGKYVGVFNITASY
jgi:hypothetical protein